MATTRKIGGAVKVALNRGVDFVPGLILRHLPRRHRELIARKLSKPAFFRWDTVRLPERIEGFEDLTFLFWNSPLNRGIIRQDFDEAAALFRIVKNLVQDQERARGVEIGRFTGGSTFMLAVALGPGGKLLSIDLMPKDDNTLRQQLEAAQLADRVELVVADANTIERDEQYDFAFIDGDHSYEGAKRDHNKWGSKVRVGGYIIHHDMSEQRPLASSRSKLKQLRLDILERQCQDLELVCEVGSLAIFQRKTDSWTPV